MVDCKISQTGHKLLPLSMVATSLKSSAHLLGAWPCDLLCVLVSEAAVTQYHILGGRLGSLNNRNLFPHTSRG